MNDASDYGTVIDTGTVRFERLLPGPVERVWTFLTDPEARGSWLAAGPMELRVGGAVELRFRHADLSPHDGPVPERYARMAREGHVLRGRVTQCEPPRLLSFTWGEDDDEPPSEVTFELTPVGTNVRLRLTHRRLDGRAVMVSVASGWHTHLDILGVRLAGGAPAPFWAQHQGWERAYEARLPRTPTEPSSP